MPPLLAEHVMIRPNWHPLLVHYPIALLTLGVFLELAGLVFRRSTVRIGARWMILLGAILAVPAATSGMYAYKEVVSPEGDGPWVTQKAQSPLNRPADAWNHDEWKFLSDHLWNNSAVTLGFLLVVCAYVACSDRWRGRVYAPCLLLLVFGLTVLGRASWHGGESVYRFQTAVYQPSDGPPPWQAPLDDDEKTTEGQAKYFLPPMQVHLALAGLTFALTLAAAAASVRAVVVGRRQAAEFTSTDLVAGTEGDIAALAVAVTPGPDAPRDRGSMVVVQRDIIVTEPPEQPAGRFWALNSAVALAALAAGLWMVGVWRWPALKALWNMREEDGGAPMRLRFHTVAGAAIVVLPILLALTMRFMRRRGIVLAIVAPLLILAAAAQLWIGILLFFDSSSGPVTGFNVPAKTVEGR